MALITINRTLVVRGVDNLAQPPRRTWRRRAAVGVSLLAAVGLSVAVTDSVATPAPQASTTNVAFVPLSPVFKLFTKKAFAANLDFSAVVSGGSTKVPSDATTVEVQITATGKTNGALFLYPAGNPSGGSGQYLSWSGGSSDTQTVEENIGTANELTFANSSSAATVTATIQGYSTQVTDADIAPADGSSGQVLTNTGSGAAWQNPDAGGPAGGALTGAYPNPELGSAVVGNANLQAGSVTNNTIADGVITNNKLAAGSVTTGTISASGGTSGQVLTNTGAGTAWEPVSTPLSFTELTPVSGWTWGSFGAPQPAIAVDPSGVVHLRGFLYYSGTCTTTTPVLAMVIPQAFWPTEGESLTVDEYNGATGRLQVYSNGDVYVSPDPDELGTGSCPMGFVSLDGLSYTLPN